LNFFCKQYGKNRLSLAINLLSTNALSWFGSAQQYKGTEIDLVNTFDCTQAEYLDLTGILKRSVSVVFLLLGQYGD
jgi:hypothetical protein